MQVGATIENIYASSENIYASTIENIRRLNCFQA